MNVEHCNSLGDHPKHEWGPGCVCPGNGPFHDRELMKTVDAQWARNAERRHGKCVCGDSIWGNVGHCPPKGNREYNSCPVRQGVLTRKNTDRYEVREHPIPQEYRDQVSHLDPECPEVMWHVWDIQQDTMVPFGQYSDRDKAQRRSNRMNDKEEGV